MQAALDDTYPRGSPPYATIDKDLDLADNVMLSSLDEIFNDPFKPLPVGYLANLGLPNFGGLDCAINSWVQALVANRE
jgi:hypothetical protein